MEHIGIMRIMAPWGGRVSPGHSSSSRGKRYHIPNWDIKSIIQILRIFVNRDAIFNKIFSESLNPKNAKSLPQTYSHATQVTNNPIDYIYIHIYSILPFLSSDIEYRFWSINFPRIKINLQRAERHSMAETLPIHNYIQTNISIKYPVKSP